MFLLDTNVLSEEMKREPNAQVLTWLARQGRVQVSVVTVMELEAGIARAPAGKRARLLTWLEGLLESEAHEVVPVSPAIARAAGQLKARAESRGKPRPLADLLIAATATVTGAVVATRNTDDFEGLGVPLLDPFE